MRRWRPDQLPSYDGRTVVVTGANSGIGWHVASALAAKGAYVTLACRSGLRGADAAARITAQVPDALVRVEPLDLSSLASVADFAQRWTGPLDLLVNNAGVMTPPSYRTTEDGFELQLGTNHLGHFALTAQLLPALLAAPVARVVTVSSVAHHGGTPAVLQGNPAEGYKAQQYYQNSKLANLLFARELQRRADEHDATLTSTAAHPGVAATNLFSSGEGQGSRLVVRALAPLVLPVVLQSARAGAEPVLYAAAVAEPGSYSGPQLFGEWRGPAGPARVSPYAQDDALAALLFDKSEELTGTRFLWP